MASTSVPSEKEPPLNQLGFLSRATLLNRQVSTSFKLTRIVSIRIVFISEQFESNMNRTINIMLRNHIKLHHSTRLSIFWHLFKRWFLKLVLHHGAFWVILFKRILLFGQWNLRKTDWDFLTFTNFVKVQCSYILRMPQKRFDSYYIGQIYGGDLAKFCGLLRICDFYLLVNIYFHLTSCMGPKKQARNQL